MVRNTFPTGLGRMDADDRWHDRILECDGLGGHALLRTRNPSRAIYAGSTGRNPCRWTSPPARSLTTSTSKPAICSKSREHRRVRRNQRRSHEVSAVQPSGRDERHPYGAACVNGHRTRSNRWSRNARNTPRTRPASTVASGDAPRVESANPGDIDGPAVDSDLRLAAHQRMLDQMRISVTPQMVQIMNADPLVDSRTELQELERYEADIDRMLARTP